MSFIDMFKTKQKPAKPYTVYDAFGTLDKVAEQRKDYFEDRLTKLHEKEAKAKESLKKLQAEIADTKTFLKYGNPVQ